MTIRNHKEQFVDCITKAFLDDIGVDGQGLAYPDDGDIRRMIVYDGMFNATKTVEALVEAFMDCYEKLNCADGVD